MNDIKVDFDSVVAEVKRLARELQELPSPSEVTHVEGDVSNTTYEFHRAVSRSAREMGAVTEKTVEKLQSTLDAILAAVEDFAEQEYANVGEMDQLAETTHADEVKLDKTKLDKKIDLIGSRLDSAVESPVAPAATGANTKSADQPEKADF